LCLVERQRQAGLHIFAAEAKARPAEIDIRSAVGAGSHAQCRLVFVDGALDDLDMGSGVCRFEVACDLLQRHVGGIVVEVQRPERDVFSLDGGDRNSRNCDGGHA